MNARAPHANPWLSREKAELGALLSLPGIGNGRLRDMLALFGSPAGAWEAVLQGAAAGPDPSAGSWSEIAGRTDPGRLAERLESVRMTLITIGEDDYPAALREIHDPPLAVFLRGRLAPEKPSIAIVGMRKATAYGLEAARWLARGLAAAGLSVVSGAAYGIDAAAHNGALEASGHTCAVLGAGVDVVYPRSHAKLFARIEESGALLSEYFPGTEPRPYQFPARNRIIAGFSRAVIVVEAGERSGALITAELALAEGRDVLAVPGQVFSPASRGTHKLLRAGAAIVTSPDEVLEELGLDVFSGAPAGATDSTEGLRPDEVSILAALDSGPTDVESIAGAAGLHVARAVSLLGEMELARLVTRAAGNRYQKCSPR